MFENKIPWTPAQFVCLNYRNNFKDGKHSVFGRVVGGNDTLRELELHPTDKKTDRPIDDIKILSTEVFVDPYPDAEKALIEARKKV